MTASAWADPPAVGYNAHKNALLPVSDRMLAAAPHAVAFTGPTQGYPAMSAIRADVAAVECWELTEHTHRFSVAQLLVMSSEWRLLSSGVDEEAAS